MNSADVSRIQAALNAANGKRRERLADLDDVVSVIVRVAKGEDKQGIRRICGTVPNSYSYRASATVITAARVGDWVRVRIYDGYAAKVSWGGNGHQEGSKSADVLALVAAEELPAGAFTIPLASAKRAPRKSKAAA